MLYFNALDLMEGPSPLYAWYPGQSEPQPAYIYLSETGGVSAGYSGEIGTARPADEWHGVTLAWRITPFLSAQAVKNLLTTDPVAYLLERVHVGHDTRWDGSNYVGELTADAQDASDELEDIFSGVEPDIDVWSAEDWLFSCAGLFDCWPGGMGLAQAVADAEDSASTADMLVILHGDVADALLDRAQYYLTSLHPGLGRTHFDALLADGRATPDDIDGYIREVE